jgi:plastocyanin
MRRRSFRALPVLLIVSALVWLATPAFAATIVKGDGSVWKPSSVTIDRGEAVRWKAVFRTHILKAYGGNWTFRQRLDEGESVRHRFTSKGTFRFFCTIHGSVSGGVCTGMCGKVRVT